MDDVCDPEWKIVRQIEPRSRRVTSEQGGETLSAAGRVDAVLLSNVRGDNVVEGPGGEIPQPIPAAMVDQVMAEEALDEEDTLQEETDPVDEMEETEVDTTTVPFHYRSTWDTASEI